MVGGAVDSGAIAIAVALLSGTVAVGNTVYTQRLEKQRRAESKKDTLEALMARYRDPLLQAAFDLQSRIWNMLGQEFLDAYYFSQREDERAYARDNTLYVIAEYLGWVEVLRREVRFLDLGDETHNTAWTLRRDAVRRALLTDDYAPPFRLFNGQQRAIGELMLCPSTTDDERRDCLGYAMFTRRLQEPEFASWFASLREDLDLFAREPERHDERLRALQPALIDLIDCLDPSHGRLPVRDLQKLPPARAAV